MKVDGASAYTITGCSITAGDVGSQSYGLIEADHQTCPLGKLSVNANLHFPTKLPSWPHLPACYCDSSDDVLERQSRCSDALVQHCYGKLAGLILLAFNS